MAVFFASSQPDGLERVAEDNGFLDAAQGPVFNVIPDYLVPGVPNETLAAVSYTHLDVYKRQVVTKAAWQRLEKAEQAEASKRGLESFKYGTNGCLLYTSRCV